MHIKKEKRFEKNFMVWS